MYMLILLTVFSSLITMFLAFQYEKEIKNQNKSRINITQIFISSILMGALGSVFAIIGFDFQKENKRFVIASIILAIIQIILIFVLGSLI